MDPARDTSFVYHLMSNASMSVYPDNKPQHFKTLLPIPLTLDGEWEVGLSTIIYAHNWNQLKYKSFLTISMPVTKLLDNSKTIETIRLEFTQQQFDSLEQLVRILNDSINIGVAAHLQRVSGNKATISPQGSQAFAHLEFTLSASPTRRISLKNYGYGEHFKVALPANSDPARDLWRILGFEDTVREVKEGNEARNPASLNLHFPSLYVYSPIIEYVGVGDTHAPLLGVVPIRGKLGEIVYERFDKPIYLRVQQRYMAEMEISIKDDTGDDVQFGAAKNIVILHFRRRS